MEKNTLPILSKYERASLIARRADEIARGYSCLIQNPTGTNPIEIATEEFEQKKIPYKVVRTLPDGRIEEWSLAEMMFFG